MNEKKDKQNDTMKQKETCLTLTFSPDGKVVASGFSSGVIRLWDFETRKEMMLLKGHKDEVKALVYTPDGKTLISGSSDRRIIIWDSFKGEMKKMIRGHWGSINSLSLNQTGKILASAATDKRLKLWDFDRDWKKISDNKVHEDSISVVKFSPVKDLYASASWDHTINLWELNKDKKLVELKGHFGPIYDISFSPDGTKLVSCSSDGVLKLWSVEKGRELKQFETIETAFSSVAFHPNGKIFASGSTDNLVKLWDIETGKEIKKLVKHQSAIIQVIFSPNGKLLLSMSRDGNLQSWNIEKLLEVKEPGIFARAKDAITSGQVKQMVDTFWSKSFAKLLDQSDEQEPADQLKEKMITELPNLILVMQDGDELKIGAIKSRYNCSQKVAEDVVVHLLREGLIAGTFNPFSGILLIKHDTQDELELDDEDLHQTVDMLQTCFYCGEPLNVEDQVCPSCNEEIAKCPVCKLSIDFDAEVGVCVYCGSKGHLSHMKEAVKVTGICPICRKEMNWDSEITSFKRKPKKEV